MTNKDLYCYVQQAKLHQPALQKDGTTYFAYLEAVDLDFLVLTDGEGTKVGCVVANSIDVYIYIIDEFRGQGYMSKFLDSGVLEEAYPEAKQVSITIADDLDMVKTRYHLAKKHNFIITNENEVLDCLEHPEKYCLNEDYDYQSDESWDIFKEYEKHNNIDKDIKIAAALYIYKQALNDLSDVGADVYDYQTKYYLRLMHKYVSTISDLIDNNISRCNLEQCYDLTFFPDWQHIDKKSRIKLVQQIHKRLNELKKNVPPETRQY